MGDWKRVNEAEGLQTFESWRKNSGKEYEGLGFTLKLNDTIFIEEMLLQQDSGQWSLIITGGDNQPTTFKVIVVEKKKFVAENLANEFPQKIRYFKNAANLNAVISKKGE